MILSRSSRVPTTENLRGPWTMASETPHLRWKDEGSGSFSSVPVRRHRRTLKQWRRGVNKTISAAPKKRVCPAEHGRGEPDSVQSSKWVSDPLLVVSKGITVKIVIPEEKDVGLDQRNN